MSRDSEAYAQFRVMVLARDQHQCRKCGARERLTVHHKQRFARYPERALDLDNGMTLCKDCHRKEHRGKESVQAETTWDRPSESFSLRKEHGHGPK